MISVRMNTTTIVFYQTRTVSHAAYACRAFEDVSDLNSYRYNANLLQCDKVYLFYIVISQFYATGVQLVDC